MDFGRVQVMEFLWHLLRKWDFNRIWSHFRPNCRQEDMRKSISHFLQDTYIFAWKLVWIWTKLPFICDHVKKYGISMKILVTFFTGLFGLGADTNAVIIY